MKNINKKTILVFTLVFVVVIPYSLLLIYFVDQNIKNSKRALQNETVSTEENEECLDADLKYTQVLKNDELEVREAEIAEGCTYNPNLVSNLSYRPFTSDYSLTEKFRQSAFDGRPELRERSITVKDIVFKQYAKNNEGDLFNLDIFLKGKLIFQKRIDTLTCNISGHVSYVAIGDKLYFAYYSGEIVDDGKDIQLERRFYQVSQSGITDLHQEKTYEGVSALFSIDQKLLYFYSKEGNANGFNYDGKEYLEGRYESLENACCCEPSIWKIQGNNSDTVAFFAKKDGKFVKVLVEGK